MVSFRTGAGFASMMMHHTQTMFFMRLNIWRELPMLLTLSASVNFAYKCVQVAWAVALQNDNRPTALLLSRQNLPYLPKGNSAAKDASGLDAINKGAYVLAEPTEVGMSKKAQAVIIATGSEVQLAMKAQALLAEHKVAVRVVSMPSTTTFDRQSVAYKSAVLPKGIPRIAVEMGSTDGWWKYGVSAVVGIDTYGESAPAPVLFEHFGFTPRNVADTVLKVLQSL